MTNLGPIPVPGPLIVVPSRIGAYRVRYLLSYVWGDLVFGVIG